LNLVQRELKLLANEHKEKHAALEKLLASIPLISMISKLMSVEIDFPAGCHCYLGGVHNLPRYTLHAAFNTTSTQAA
jgi:hypothetical protein